MTSSTRQRFALLPAGPGWLLNGWPRSVGIMQQVGFAQPCSGDDLAWLCAWAGLYGGSHGNRVAPSALSRLTRVAARNGRSNHYHHAGHFAHVMMAAAMLAARAGINPKERNLLILAALVHDLDHHGRRAKAYPLYKQERLSARLAGRILLRHSGDPRLVRRLERLIVATALTSDPHREAILASDPLARLLCDADVFASLFYDRGMALKITGMLKLEQGLAGEAAALLDGFATKMEADGLKSDAGRMLLRELTASRQPRRNVVTGKG